jgi:hypothetical protein
VNHTPRKTFAANLKEYLYGKDEETINFENALDRFERNDKLK